MDVSRPPPHDADFLDSLNAQQRLAVCHNNGGALVLAGAGTGKTRVLTSRIAWLITARDCPPHAVLAVTFTNKAAKEMRGRIAALSPQAGDLMLGTFHGVCHRMLRIHSAAAGWDKNFQILDSSDQQTFLRRLLAANGADSAEFPPADVARFINAAKDRGWRAGNAAAGVSPHSREESLCELYAFYESACRRENKMDFAELLLSAIDLLRENKTLRTHYATRFRHILIDEFQDTSPLQYQWLRLLDSGNNDFFAVGDDDQSIYAFRGADPENMRRIQSDLRVREVIRLEQNYRSTGNILSAANALIAGNKNRLGKTLRTDSDDGARLQIVRAISDLDEAAAVARTIREAIENGARADEIAILYRANSQSRLLEQAMVKYGLPYRIYGGTRFFDRMEIKHALAYLRLAITNDRDALLRVINTPPRGIGAKTIETLAGDMFAALFASSAPKVRAFAALLNKLRALRESESLQKMARAAVQNSGLLDYYESNAQEERAENLREFVNAAAQFEKEFTGETEEDALSEFLANAALESGESQGENGEAVNLSTVHAAKGLEFAIVHIAGLEDGTFPHSHSLDAVAADAVEEERRLMYVAITRARRELFLHFADRRMVFGQTVVRPPSRFLNELPPATVAGNCTAPAGLSRPPFRSAPKNVAKSPVSAAPTQKTEIAESPKSPYRRGTIVRHQRHGDGVIINFEGGGKDLTIEVAFKTCKKKFNADIARLQIVR